MKRIITLFFSILAVCIIANAKIVFVAASGDNSDGSTWAKALTSIPNSGSSAITSGDSVFVKGGVGVTYSFSASVSNNSAFATKADVNYLGGFAGTESNSAQRVKSDLDNNGIIEPWEFSNASTLSFNSTNNAYGLYINSNTAKRIFDGFTITGTLNVGQLSASTGGNNMVKINNYTIFRNNILSFCTLSAAPNTATANMGYTKGALIFMGQPTTTTGGSNTVDNCLIENNTSTVTPTATQTQDVQQSPFVHIDASNTTGRNVLSNCVFRKNQIMLEYKDWGGSTYNNPRGMLVSISIYGSSSLIGQYNCIKNLLVHNNSATFNPKTGVAATTNLGNGGLIYTYNTAQATYDSIVNCTVANNSMMRIGYAIRGGFTNTTQPYHVIANNVLLDNKNNNGSGTITVQNLIINQVPAGSAGTITIANNIGNGGFSATANVNNVFGNITDLSSTNTDATKGAKFSSPPANTLIGYSTDATVATSRWTIETGSYLAAKGVALPAPSRDKLGGTFASPPAVGAYELRTTPTLSWTQTALNLATTDSPVTLTAATSSYTPSSSPAASAITYSSDNTNVVTVNGSTVTVVGAGTANIKASQVANVSYNAATALSIAVTVTAPKITPVITWTQAALNLDYPGSTVSLTAASSTVTPSSTPAGTPITYASDNSSVVTISGTTLTIVGPGLAHITANQASNSSYNAASSSAVNVIVKATPVISWTQDLTVIKSTDSPLTLTASSTVTPSSTPAGSSIVYTSTDPTIVSVSGSVLTVLKAGTTTITATQAGNTYYYDAASVSKSVTVTQNGYRGALISNGTFELGTDASTNVSWWQKTGTVANFTYAIDNTSQITGANCAKLSVTTIGSVTQCALFQYMTLPKPSTYTVTFKAKASTACTIQAALVQSYQPFGWISGGSASFNLTTSTQTFSYDITTTSATGLCKFALYFGNVLTDIYLDDITIVEKMSLTNANMCNGDFETTMNNAIYSPTNYTYNGLTSGTPSATENNLYFGWSLLKLTASTAAMSATTETGVDKITGSQSIKLTSTGAATATSTDLQLAYVFAGAKDKQYNVYFKAKASTSTTMGVMLQAWSYSASPTITYLSEQTINLTTSVQTFGFTTTNAFLQPDGRNVLQFLLGKLSNGVSVWIDDVVVQPVQAAVTTPTISWSQSLTGLSVGSSPVSLTASSDYSPASSPVASGITYGSSNTAAITVSGSTLTIVGAGTSNITAYQTADATGNYSAATVVIQSVTIAKGTPTITVTPVGTYTYNGSPQGPNTVTKGGSTGAVTYSYVGVNGTSYTASPTQPTNDGNYTVTASVAADANYNAASSSATAFSIFSTGNIISDTNVSSLTLSASSDLSVSTGYTLTIDANTTVNSVTLAPGAKLTLNSSRTLTTGTLTLQSDATGTGTFVDNGGTLNATTTNVQQYLSSGRNWYISSPLSGTTSAVFSATNANPLYYYDETIALNASSNAWAQIKNTGTALSPTTGYIANMDATVLSNQSNIVTFTGGNLNTGTITTGQNGVPALTYTDNNYKKGFNLVGNPYPSYLDWDNVIKTNVMGSIWLRTKVSNTYLFDTYNASGQLGTSNSGIPVNNHIPPMQAFWVRATSSGASLGFDNSMRSHKGSQITGEGVGQLTINDRVFKAPVSKDQLQSVLRLQISNGLLSDETILYSNPNALNSFDDYDTPKMFSNSSSLAEIYTVTGTEQLAINGLNSIAYDTEFPLGFTTLSTGNFSIKASQIANFPAGTQVILKDNADTNSPVITDLTDGSNYSFSSGAISNNTSRFALIFRAPSVATGINTESNGNLWISTCNGQLVINGAGNGASLEVFNAVGQKLISKSLTRSAIQTNKNLPAGAYIVKVTNEGKSITRKIIID